MIVLLLESKRLLGLLKINTIQRIKALSFFNVKSTVNSTIVWYDESFSVEVID